MFYYKTKDHSLKVVYLTFSICCFFVSTLSVHAQGNLLITPKRLVFDGTKRAQELNLVNIGQDTVTYTISFVQNRMKEDGSFEQIDTPDAGQNFANKNLRFFPRKVTLGPQEVQTVKVQTLRLTELADGEYRSHLYFRAEPRDRKASEKEAGKDTGISVKIIPVFGISVPAIIRKGFNNTSIAFSNVSFDFERDTIPVVSFTINRAGDMSVYGDITVEHVSPTGKVTRAGLVKGLAVYTPNPLRYVKVELDRSLGIDYHSGTLHTVYSDPLIQKIAQREIGLR